MSEATLVAVWTCAAIAAFLNLLRGARRASAPPPPGDGSPIRPSASPQTASDLPIQPAPGLPPGPGRPAQPRGGRRELPYHPRACSRARRDGFTDTPRRGRVYENGR